MLRVYIILYLQLIIFVYHTEKKMFKPPVVPRDADGYVKSFVIDDLNGSAAKEARAFFDEYGFVVIANVFTLEQCQQTIEDIWNVIESLVGKQIRHDPTLWTSK